MSTEIQQPGKLTIRDRLESNDFKSAVAKALPKHLTPDRFIRVACTAMTKTPKLLQCDQASFFAALLTLSQLGLEPDGRRAHLIPFGDQVQLIIDYKGLVELIMRSGMVSNLHADIVCANDIFGYDIGQIKMHKINFMEPRGPVYAVYCIARFKDGSEKCDVMTVDEVEAIRSRSRAAKNGPWVTDWNEMAKKTVFRRLSKWLPLSPEFRDAIDADDDTPIDISTTTRFDISAPPSGKPNIGPKTETPKPAEKNITPEKPAEEKPKRAKKVETVETQAAAGDARATESEPSDNDGDLGPTTANGFTVTPELQAKLMEIKVSPADFDKWVMSSGRDEAWKADPIASSAKLLADERALKKLKLIHGAENAGIA